MRVCSWFKTVAVIIAIGAVGCRKSQRLIFDELIVPLKGVPGVLEFGMKISEIENRFDIVRTHELWYLIPELGTSVETFEDGSVFRIVFYFETEKFATERGEVRMKPRDWKIFECPELSVPYRMRDVERQFGKVYDIDRMCNSPIVYSELLARGEMTFHEKVWADDDSRILVTCSHKRLQLSNLGRDCHPEMVGVIVSTAELGKSVSDWLTVGAEQNIEPCQGRCRITVDCLNDESVLVMPVSNLMGRDIRFEIEFDNTLRRAVAGIKCLRAGRSSFLIFTPARHGRLQIDYSCVPASANSFLECRLECKVIPDERQVGGGM